MLLLLIPIAAAPTGIPLAQQLSVLIRHVFRQKPFRANYLHCVRLLCPLRLLHPCEAYVDFME